MTTDASDQNLQCSPGELSDEVWDAIVVGAGPAGATAAQRLASNGHRVLLVDKEQFPRDKVCADGIIADAMRCMSRSRVLERVERQAFAASEAVVFSPSRISLPLPGRYLTLRRYDLDAILVEAACEAGAIFCRAEVARIAEKKDHFTCLLRNGKGGHGALRARVVLVGTGARVPLLRELGLVKRIRPSAVAVRCYVRSSARLDRLLLSYDRSVLPGYAWIFPLGNGLYNFGGGVFLRFAAGMRVSLVAALERFMSTFPIAREIMAHGERVTPIRGAPLRCGLEGVTPSLNGRLFVIGESVGATLPYSGEGIGKAMETAEIAAEAADSVLSCNDANRACSYEERLTCELKPRYRGYETAEN